MAEDLVDAAKATPLLIFPFNGNGLEALDCVGDTFDVVGFIDDTPGKQQLLPYRRPVWPRAALGQRRDAKVLAVPGGPATFGSRRAVIEALGVDPSRYARVIHPTAWVSPRASIGHNVLIMAGVVITSNAVVGDHVCILPNTVVHHDAKVGSWSLLGSNVTVAGGTQVGENCYIGSGCSIMNGLTIGDGCLVGLGSTVIRSVAAGSRIAGNPARSI